MLLSSKGSGSVRGLGSGLGGTTGTSSVTGRGRAVTRRRRLALASSVASLAAISRSCSTPRASVCSRKGCGCVSFRGLWAGSTSTGEWVHTSQACAPWRLVRRNLAAGSAAGFCKRWRACHAQCPALLLLPPPQCQAHPWLPWCCSPWPPEGGLPACCFGSADAPPCKQQQEHVRMSR